MFMHLRTGHLVTQFRSCVTIFVTQINYCRAFKNKTVDKIKHFISKQNSINFVKHYVIQHNSNEETMQSPREISSMEKR